MSVAKIIEISSTSTRSFEDAIQQGINRAAATVHGIRSAWVKELRCDVQDKRITNYQVNLLLTFVLDEGGGGARARGRAGSRATTASRRGGTRR